MGIAGSKSTLERRNTIARRSQRRVIHNIKAKVERVYQDIKKFKGTEEDDDFNALISELDHLKTELMKKSKDLQPQVQNICEITFSKIDNAVLTLENKLLENREKSKKKEIADEEKTRKKKEKNHIDQQTTNDFTITEEQNEVDELAASSEKRKTLEVKFVQIFSPGEKRELSENHVTTSKVVSPEDKRKSILKVGGVPVMPTAMANELSSRSKKISDHSSKNENVQTPDNLTRVNEIINTLQNIECQIADFVGRKYGSQYQRIRDQLNEYLSELNEITTNDEYVNEQVKLCQNYVISNLNFLDDKAVSDYHYKSTDDVFLQNNNNVPLSPKEAEEKYQKLTKITAI